MQQQNRSRNHDRDEPPSPPRPSNVNAVSMDSLLALAKQAENKFIQATTSNKTSSNKQAKSIQVHQNQSGLQQLSRKRKPGDDDEADCEAKGAQDDGAEKKKKRRKKSKNKDNNASKVSSDEILGESQRNSSCDNAVQDDNNGENLNDYPYPVEGDDHCESPLEAYQDIKHVLDLYNQQVIRKLPGDFAIYDPYFCEGSVIERLTATGYPNVYNRKEDFYTTMRLRAIPPHDVLLTNPPYSSDHMERLLRFVANNNDSRPFCLLVPNYVYMKDYFQKIVSSSNNMFYIVPKKRYLYTTPKGRRQQKSSKFTSPFPTFWYCGNFKPDLVNKLANHVRDLGNSCSFTLARNASMIPLEAAPDNDPRKKKLRNSLKRKKNKDKKKQQGQKA